MISAASRTTINGHLATCAPEIRDALIALARAKGDGSWRGGLFPVLPNRDDVPTEGAALATDSPQFQRRWTPRRPFHHVPGAEGQPAVPASGPSWKDIYDRVSAAAKTAMRYLDRRCKCWIQTVDARTDLSDRTKIGAVLYVQQKDAGGTVCERAVGAGFTDDKTHGWEEIA